MVNYKKGTVKPGGAPAGRSSNHRAIKGFRSPGGSLRRIVGPNTRRQHYHSYSRNVRNHWGAYPGGRAHAPTGYSHNHGGRNHSHRFSSGVQQHWGRYPGGYSDSHRGYYHSHGRSGNINGRGMGGSLPGISPRPPQPIRPNRMKPSQRPPQSALRRYAPIPPSPRPRNMKVTY